MKRRTFLTAASLVAGASVASTVALRHGEAEGTLRTNVPMRSDLLNMETRYTVYVPGNHSDDEPVPIVYLLHGVFDDNTAWARYCDLKRLMDSMINEGRIPPMVVVTPDARRDLSLSSGDQPCTYCMNDADGSFLWEDMFMRELVPHVESTYNAGGSAQLRGISGYSMGGFGALLYTTLYPGTFCAVAGMSPSTRTEDQVREMELEEYNRVMGSGLGLELEGDDRINDRFWHYNVADAIRRTPVEQLQDIGFYLDTGSEDEYTLIGNSDVQNALGEQGIEHDVHTEPGVHEWDYWRGSTPRALEFLSARFATSA